MLIKNRYSVLEMLRWTRIEILIFFGYALFLIVLYKIFGLTFLRVPWTPVALVGTAVAFILSFQNSAAYGRIWEARKIWGGIVNASRSWGMKTMVMINNDYSDINSSDEELKIHKEVVVYRHIGWLTALRHAMRESRPWEVFSEHKTNQEWANIIHIPENIVSLEKDLTTYLTDAELEYVMGKKNKTAAILYLQSKHLQDLKEKGVLWEFSFLELENLLQEFFTLQGKAERIKNFPYPRQYASLSYVFVGIFLILLPFGIIPEFASIGESLKGSFPWIGINFVWLAAPFCVIVSWVFHTMQRIGTTGENPFEGSANDVPISTISRGIEIDLRQLLDEDHESIPNQFPEEYSVQM